MLHDVISAEAIGARRLLIRFDDGVDGVLDVSRLVTMSGLFEPLRDAGFFRQVQVHPELKVVCWPNGADLDSDVLYYELRVRLHER